MAYPSRVDLRFFNATEFSDKQWDFNLNQILSFLTTNYDVNFGNVVANTVVADLSGSTGFPSSDITLLAGEPIAANKYCRVVGNELFLATNQNDNGVTNLIGLSKTAGDTGESVTVQFYGVANGLSGLTPNATYYVGVDGDITDTQPVSRAVSIGFAISATKLYLNLQSGADLYIVGNLKVAGNAEINGDLKVAGNAEINGILSCIKSDSSPYDMYVRNTHGTGLARIIAQNNGTNMNAQMVSDDANGRAYYGTSIGANNFMSVYSGISGSFKFEINSAELMRLTTTGLGINCTPSYSLDVSGTARITGSAMFSGTAYVTGNVGIGFAVQSSTALFVSRSSNVNGNASYGRIIQDGNNTTGIGIRGEALTNGTADGQTIYAGYFDAYNGGGATNLTAYALYTARGDVCLNALGGEVAVGTNDDWYTRGAAKFNLLENTNSTDIKMRFLGKKSSGAPSFFSTELNANTGATSFSNTGNKFTFNGAVSLSGNIPSSTLFMGVLSADGNVTLDQSITNLNYLNLAPTVLGTQTATNLNYIYLNNLVLSGGTITNRYFVGLNADLGVHVATTNLDKTGNAKSGTLKVNVNGTLYHIQLYANT